MKTTHNMNLNNSPFNRIKDGTKIIELRLNDEKKEITESKRFDRVYK